MKDIDVNSGVRKVIRGERGGIGIVVLFVVLLALLLTPFILDFAIVQYGRRVAQTGADAASLAAIKEYAMLVSGGWHGYCGEPKEMVLWRYRYFVIQSAWSGIGQAWAADYAVYNETQLTEYRSYPVASRFEYVDDVPMPYIYVDVETQKPLSLFYEELYGQSFSSPAQARAESYVQQFDHWQTPCSLDGETLTMHHFSFSWAIRLALRP